MAINKIQQTTDTLPVANTGEWAWFKIVSDVLQFNSDGTNTRSVVTTNQTQTLSNKTFTAPVLGAASATSLALTATTNQIATGASTNITTVNFPASSGAVTLTMPNTTDTIVGRATTDTLTNKTLTAPTINAAINGDFKVLAATATATSNVVPATLTGFSWSVAAGGTYVFDVELPATMTTNGGLTVNFKLTTATLTSIRYSTYASTASDNTTAVSTTGTTTTDATKVFDSAAAAYTRVRVFGSMVVNAAGTFAWQFCQNTSHSDTTSVLIGSTARLSRVA